MTATSGTMMGARKTAKSRAHLRMGLLSGGSILGGVALIAAVTAGVVYGGRSRRRNSSVNNASTMPVGDKGGNENNSATQLQRVADAPLNSN